MAQISDFQHSQDEHPVDWLVTPLLQHGFSGDEICERLDWESWQLSEPNATTSVEKYLKLFAWAAQKFKDPTLGLTFAKETQPHDFGLFGYILDNAATIRDMCLFVDHYFEVLTSYYGFSFSTSGEQCTFRYHEERVSGCDGRQDIELSLGALVGFFRRKLGRRWRPASCSFTYSPPAKLRKYHKFFGRDLKFDQDRNLMIFDRTILERDIRGSNPELLSTLRQQADKILEQSPGEKGITRKVRLMLSSRLGKSELSATAIAAELNISVRQIHRVLGAENTSFRTLRNDIVHSAGREALELSADSISEISEQLGYSETSAFVRAFKHVEGISPLQFRKRVCE